jgi:hypothetical protein
VLQAVLPAHCRCTAALMRPLSEAERKTLVRLANKIAGEAARLRRAK